MAPYDYNREDVPDDPDWMGEWDYWRVDGRGCELPVRAGYQDDPRIIGGALTLSGTPRVYPPGTCDGRPRGLPDFDAARAPVAAEAARTFREWHEFASHYPPAQPLNHFWEKHDADPEGHPAQRVHENHDGRSVIRALHGERPDLRDRVSSCPVDYVGDDLDDFVERQVADVLPTHALLTLDGKWNHVGSLDVRRCFNAHLDQLPSDVPIGSRKWDAGSPSVRRLNTATESTERALGTTGAHMPLDACVASARSGRLRCNRTRPCPLVRVATAGVSQTDHPYPRGTRPGRLTG
ncbi:hypothetical protein [Streptomyces sp. NPDC001070]